MKSPSPAQITEKAGAHIAEADKALSVIDKEATIETMADYEAAPKVIAELKTKREALDAQRKEWVEPLNAVVASINAAFKPATTSLDKAERLIKFRLSTFRDGQEAKSNKLLEKMSKTPEGKRDALVRKADAERPPELKGVSMRDDWTADIIDAEAFVHWAVKNEQYHLLMPNEKVLKAKVKSEKKDPGIPGCNGFKKTIVSVTAKKVM